MSITADEKCGWQRRMASFGAGNALTGADRVGGIRGESTLVIPVGSVVFYMQIWGREMQDGRLQKRCLENMGIAAPDMQASLFW